MAAQLGASAGLGLMEGAKGAGKGLADMAMMVANKGQGKGGNAPAATAGGSDVTAYVSNWCSYSQKLMTQLEENKADLSAKGINVNLVECTLDENKAVCEAANITGYPTLVNGCGHVKPGYVPHEAFCDFAACSM
jgi:thiol-disulfide isomerase/thioredoxin